MTAEVAPRKKPNSVAKPVRFLHNTQGRGLCKEVPTCPCLSSPACHDRGREKEKTRAAITMNVYLLVVQGRPEGKSLLFPRGEYLFGRGDECHIRPNSDWVSRQHCLLRVTSDQVVLRDLGSRNGTLVNGERVVGERPLAHGDQLQVGPLVFQV